MTWQNCSSEAKRHFIAPLCGTCHNRETWTSRKHPVGYSSSELWTVCYSWLGQYYLFFFLLLKSKLCWFIISLLKTGLFFLFDCSMGSGYVLHHCHCHRTTRFCAQCFIIMKSFLSEEKRPTMTELKEADIHIMTSYGEILRGFKSCSQIMTCSKKKKKIWQLSFNFQKMGI